MLGAACWVALPLIRGGQDRTIPIHTSSCTRIRIAFRKMTSSCLNAHCSSASRRCRHFRLQLYLPNCNCSHTASVRVSVCSSQCW
ncbi:hypothetical protein PR003_g11554 [Phytophthora rubi]|uniref:Uncharacterized protein n=1 Tax=Phytophthora rubi TaxID=129364 RepID=A0A6A4FMZ5_9STRA|nr:hypothetical protein PR003_g11554 [Phytophthora rubi]